MRKKFAFASIFALLLVLLSGSGARSTYSATATLATDPCQRSCELALSECASGGGNPFGYCWGQYLRCHNQCKR